MIWKKLSILGDYILGKMDLENFEVHFKGRYSKHFDPANDLDKIGVVNQTTQLATDTQAISDYLRNL